MKKEVFILGGLIAIFLTIGIVMISSKSLPEESAKNFHALSNNMSLQSEIKVIKQPMPNDNTYIYAINDAAEKAYNISRNDSTVNKILDSTKGKVVTIAAVQPTLLVGQNGQQIYSSGGEVIITANWQEVNGNIYSNPESFSNLQGKQADSHQQIWNILVDMDKGKVIGITSEPERIIQETLQSNLIYTGMNMFLPDVVKISPGTTIDWTNISNVVHNVVGIYNKTSGSKVSVDSGLIQHNTSWKYTFNEEGVFQYQCTIHSQEGMKGTIIVSKT